MNFHHWVMLLLVVSMSIVHGLTSLSDGQYYNTTKELNLGGEWDWNTLKWITKECDVEGDLSSLKNMTQLEVLNLNWCDKVTGNLEDLEGLVNLRRLEMYRVKEVEGSVSHLQKMPLTWLDLGKLSKVEGSLSYLQNMQLTWLILAGTSVSGTPSKSLISQCKEPSSHCIFTPAPKMCGAGERIIGLTCETCPNCGANGECLYGMDESDYLCESCNSGEFKVRQNGQGGGEGRKEAPASRCS